MKKRLTIFILLSFIAAGASAETKTDYIYRPNEVRAGWGDQLFESLMWHNPTNIITSMPESYEQTYHESYRHNQHVWAEYQRRFSYWFAFGALVDVSEVGWDNVVRNGAGTELSRDKNHYFYNLAIMPTVRFTYFFHPNVNIYSGFGLGVGINGGTETNAKGQHTDVGAAVNLTVVGISANYDRWFWTFDLGGMYSLKDANTIFLASSRIFSIGLGVRF